MIVIEINYDATNRFLFNTVAKALARKDGLVWNGLDRAAQDAYRKDAAGVLKALASAYGKESDG